MATSKEFRDYVNEQLEFLGDITCRSMMGDYLLYYRNVLFGGIYDGRLLVKRTQNSAKFNLTEEIPYKGAKPMYLLDDLEDREKVKEVVFALYDDLKK